MSFHAVFILHDSAYPSDAPRFPQKPCPHLILGGKGQEPADLIRLVHHLLDMKHLTVINHPATGIVRGCFDYFLALIQCCLGSPVSLVQDMAKRVKNASMTLKDFYDKAPGHAPFENRLPSKPGMPKNGCASCKGEALFLNQPDLPYRQTSPDVVF